MTRIRSGISVDGDGRIAVGIRVWHGTQDYNAVGVGAVWMLISR